MPRHRNRGFDKSTLGIFSSTPWRRFGDNPLLNGKTMDDSKNWTHRRRLSILAGLPGTVAARTGR